MPTKSKLVPIDPKEIVDELKAFIKCPMDPALRKLLRLTVAAIEALIEPPTPELETPLPALVERIKDSE
jgi:hypothetical protein